MNSINRLWDATDDLARAMNDFASALREAAAKVRGPMPAEPPAPIPMTSAARRTPKRKPAKKSKPS